jgi:hypothetical protein
MTRQTPCGAIFEITNNGYTQDLSSSLEHDNFAFILSRAFAKGSLSSKLKKQNPSKPSDRLLIPPAVDAYLRQIGKEDRALQA